MDDATRKLVDASHKRIFRQVCAHWAKFSTIEVRDIAALMQGANPDALQDVVINDYGDGIDLSSEIAMLMSAVNVGELAVFPSGNALPDDRAKVLVTTLIPWLQIRGYEVLADGLTLPRIGAAKASIMTGSSDAVEGGGAITAGLPNSSKTAFPLTKSAMIAEHEHEWPDIEADIKGASENGLSACKAGARKWDEACALDWARANKKISTLSSAVPMSNALRDLPSLVNRISG